MGGRGKRERKRERERERGRERAREGQQHKTEQGSDQKQQRAQYPLHKDYNLNQNIKASIAIFHSFRGIAMQGETSMLRQRPAQTLNHTPMKLRDKGLGFFKHVCWICPACTGTHCETRTQTFLHSMVADEEVGQVGHEKTVQQT